MIVGVSIEPGSHADGFASTLYPVGGGYYSINAPNSYTSPDSCGYYSDSGWGLNSFLGPHGGMEQSRHSLQGGQVCFADGHVKFMTAGALAAGTNWTATTDISQITLTDTTKFLWDLN